MSLTNWAPFKPRYQVRDHIELVIHPTPTPDRPAPFDARLTQSGYEVTLQAGQVVKLLKNGTLIFDGSQISTDHHTSFSIGADFSDQFEVMNRYYDRFSVCCQYQTQKAPPPPQSENDPAAQKRFFNSSIGSLIVHLILGLIILGLMQGREKLEEILINNAVKLRMESNSGGVASAIRKLIPFSGMSIRQFEMPEATPDQKSNHPGSQSLGKTASLFKSIFGGSFKSVGQPLSYAARKNDEAPKIDTQNLLNTALTNESKVRTAVQARTQSGPSANQRENQLRQSLQTIKPQLSQAFDQAVQMDPTFSVTLNIEATVDSQGKLTQIKLKSHGTYSPGTLAAFEAKVRGIMELTHVGKESAGTVLKTEHVFIK